MITIKITKAGFFQLFKSGFETREIFISNDEAGIFKRDTRAQKQLKIWDYYNTSDINFI